MESNIKELEWLRRRSGNISASELSNLYSASGKLIDTQIAYIRHKRFERKHGFVIPFSNRAMEIGKEQESYAYEWLKAHYPELDLIHATSLPDIPFWSVPELRFGASPDTFTNDRKIIIEIKTVVGIGETEFWDDDSVPYEDKEKEVILNHGPQLAGQLLSSPDTEQIWLIKYIPSRDDIDSDMDSPLADWRGHVFKFHREDFDLDDLRSRINQFNHWIDCGRNLDEIKKEFNDSLKKK